MAGKPLHELRRAAAQSRVKAAQADRAEVAKAPAPEAQPVEQKAAEPEKDRSLNDWGSAARGEENEDILAMVKSLKGMLRGD